MLQAERSPVRFPIRLLIFFYLPIPPSRTMILGSTQPLAERSTRKLPGGRWGGKGRLAHKPDNLIAICNPLSRKCGILDMLQPYWPSLPVTGIVLPFIHLHVMYLGHNKFPWPFADQIFHRKIFITLVQKYKLP
jgi:hypothetical protein